MFVYQAGYIIHRKFLTHHLRTWPPEVRHLSALGVFPATPVQLQWLGCLFNGSTGILWEKWWKIGFPNNEKEKTMEKHNETIRS